MSLKSEELGFLLWTPQYRSSRISLYKNMPYIYIRDMRYKYQNNQSCFSVKNEGKLLRFVYFLFRTRLLHLRENGSTDYVLATMTYRPLEYWEGLDYNPSNLDLPLSKRLLQNWGLVAMFRNRNGGSLSPQATSEVFVWLSGTSWLSIFPLSHDFLVPCFCIKCVLSSDIALLSLSSRHFQSCSTIAASHASC